MTHHQTDSSNNIPLTDHRTLDVTICAFLHDRFADQSGWRSEEHTSELQSQFHLVCRLLLEKLRYHRDIHSFPTRRSSDLAIPSVPSAIPSVKSTIHTRRYANDAPPNGFFKQHPAH